MYLVALMALLNNQCRGGCRANRRAAERIRAQDRFLWSANEKGEEPESVQPVGVLDGPLQLLLEQVEPGFRGGQAREDATSVVGAGPGIDQLHLRRTPG